MTGSQIPSTLFNNSENDLLIITSQPTSNSSIFGNTNDDNYSELNRSSYGSSGSGSYSSPSSSSDDDALSSLNTIYHAKVFDSIPYPGNSSNNLQDTIDNHINDNTDYGDSSNNYTHRQQAQPPSMEALSDYPYGQLGQVAVVSVPSTTTATTISSSSTPSSSFANETTQTEQTPYIEEDNLSTPYPLPFGLNKTTAFIADFGNSSASGAASALNLPKIMMLDIQTGNITPFLALKHSDPYFTPIDIVFDYNRSALYVLSTGNNQEENANNNNNNNATTPTNNTNDLPNTSSLNNKSSGVIWKISYQGEEPEAASDSNSSSINNSTDNNNNDSDDDATSSLTSSPSSSSSNDTDSFDNITDSSIEDNNGLDDESFSYDEDEDDTDDDNIGTDDNSSSSNNEVDTDDTSEGSASSSPPPSDSSSQDTTTPPPDDSSTTPPASAPPDEQSPSTPPSTIPPPPPPPSKDPENEAPVANDQRIEIEEDAPSVDIELTATDNNYGDIQNLEFTIVSDPTHGMLGEIQQQEEGSSGDRGSDNSQVAKATVTYTPDENYNGQDTFQFKVNDGHNNNKADSNTAAATVTINITPVNDAPIAEDDTATTDQDTAVLIDVLANDADIDEQSNNGDDSFTVDSVDKQSTQGGSIARVNTGSGDNNDNNNNNDDDSGRGTHNEKIEYTPAEGFSGTDKFTYTIIDSNGATESATVTVTVNAAAVSETEELPTGALEDGEGKSDNDND